MRMTDCKMLTARETMQSGKSLEPWRPQDYIRAALPDSSDLIVAMHRAQFAHYTVVRGTDFRAVAGHSRSQPLVLWRCETTPPPRPGSYGDSKLREKRPVVTD
jgi:hypothetical protein